MSECRTDWNSRQRECQQVLDLTTDKPQKSKRVFSDEEQARWKLEDERMLAQTKIKFY